jgi:hypothetical protein
VKFFRPRTAGPPPVSIDPLFAARRMCAEVLQDSASELSRALLRTSRGVAAGGSRPKTSSRDICAIPTGSPRASKRSSSGCFSKLLHRRDRVVARVLPHRRRVPRRPNGHHRARPNGHRPHRNVHRARRNVHRVVVVRRNVHRRHRRDSNVRRRHLQGRNVHRRRPVDHRNSSAPAEARLRHHPPRIVSRARAHLRRTTIVRAQAIRSIGSPAASRRASATCSKPRA